MLSFTTYVGIKCLQPPPLPTIHVNRQGLLDEIVSKLLQVKVDPDTFEATLTIVGAGGFGKTTIVTSLCHHDIVKAHFTDGFLFIELGQQANDPIIKLRAIYNLLTGKQCGINVVEQKINQHTSDYCRNLLVIVDDVWHVEDARPFVNAFSSCKIVLTTRMNDIQQHIPSKHLVTIGPMRHNEAFFLLTNGVFDVSQLSQKNLNSLRELAQDVFLWPLLLSLTRGQLSHYVKIRGFSNHQAIESVQVKLRHGGLVAIGGDNTEIARRSHRFAVKACIELTLQLLSKSLSDKIKKLILWTGIGTSLQVAVLNNLWNITQQEANDAVDKLWAYGLVQFTDVLISPYNKIQHCVEVHTIISLYIINSIDGGEAFALSPIIGKKHIVETVNEGLSKKFQQLCGVHDLSKLSPIDNLKYTLTEIENVVFPFSVKQVNLYTVNDPYIIMLKLKDIQDTLIRSPHLLVKVDKEIDLLITDCKQLLNDSHNLCRKLNQMIERNLHEKSFHAMTQTIEEFMKNYPLCHIAEKAASMVEMKIKPYCDVAQHEYITLRCESLHMLKHGYHEISLTLLPEIKLFLELHRQISISLCKGPRDIQQTYQYLRSGKFKEKYMKLETDACIKLQKVAPNCVYQQASHPYL